MLNANGCTDGVEPNLGVPSVRPDIELVDDSGKLTYCSVPSGVRDLAFFQSLERSAQRLRFRMDSCVCIKPAEGDSVEPWSCFTEGICSGIVG